MYQRNALARRRFLGLHIAEPPKHERLRGRTGVYVAAALEGGAAANAGVGAGDFVVAIDGEPMRDAGSVLEMARKHRQRTRVVFRVRRGNETLDCEGLAPALSVEHFAEGEVQLGDVLVGGHRLRTIATIPAMGGPHPAVLCLQGVREQSCEFPLDLDNPMAKLVEGWTRAGFVVLRLERSGVGDSEGPHPSRTDLGAEIDGYDAGLDALLERADVDRTRVLLFGQSFGGMIAPLVALERRLAGVVVFGTSAAKWHDCVMASSERQRRLAGLDNAGVGQQMALWSELHALVCREGWTPARAFERRPHLRRLRSRDCDGETLYGRHVALFRQLEDLDLGAAWRAVSRTGASTLVLRGEYDWVCSRQEGENIVSAVGETHGRYLELERIGHDLCAHDDLAASFQRPREGRWDGRLLEATVPFMRAVRTTP